MRGRPQLRTSYAQDQALLDTTTKRVAMALFMVALVAFPFVVSEGAATEFNTLLARAFMVAIGAIGINIVAGYAGQLSLAHAFFLGIGAFSAAVISGPTDGRHVGYGIDQIWIWLPLSGLIPALVAYVVGPLAMRVRGLYLAVLTIGLVFLGLYVFDLADGFTGGLGLGRATAEAKLFGWDLTARGEIAGLPLDRPQRLYFLGLIVLVLLAWLAANLLRSAPGRAFQAVRDRDIAAELMGVELQRTKVLAFTISAFYAGICGALLSLLVANVNPETYGLLFSIEFVAMILIGGLGTLTGALLGAAFVVLLPRVIEELPGIVPFLDGGSSGGRINTSQLEIILYGVMIIVVIILEPRGAYGLWLRIRNYFKAWPFSY